ncbi:threonine/serine exporter family protein, partial [Streptomyces rubiginosohelvolus]
MVAESGGPEDQKPQSDEARSAFAPPAGTMHPVSPPEEDHPTSEFAIPTGVQPEQHGPAGSGGGSGGGSNSDTLSSAFTPPSTYKAQQ